MQEIKSQLVRLHQPFSDLGEQLLDVFLQTLPDVILVDVEFRRKITFNGESLTITRRVGVCPICHANFGCCQKRKKTKKRQKRPKKDKKQPFSGLPITKKSPSFQLSQVHTNQLNFCLIYRSLTPT